MRALIATALIAAQVWSVPSQACSSFASTSPNFRLMAKSYDFQLSHGIALINKRNMRKTALVSPGERAAEWTSKYGSLTYTQFGRDFPLSGVNEKGLAIEILWDFSTNGPSNTGSLPVVNEVQWIQYQLDMSATVAEVIANSRRVRMKKVYAPIHYFVCDAQGQCATFEFDGTRVDITDAARAPALTNTNYLDALNYLKGYVGFGGRAPIPFGSYQSNDRFVILNSQLKALNAKATAPEGVSYSWDMLKSVRSRGLTQWQMVHDLKNGLSYFRKMFEERVVRITDLKRFDFSCKKPAMILDLEGEDSGDTTGQYVDYDPALNRETVKLSGQALGMGEDLINAAAAYPESTVCVE